MNSRDEIVDEVRAAREAYAEQFDYDLQRICKDLKLKEGSRGRLANLKPTEPKLAESKPLAPRQDLDNPK